MISDITLPEETVEAQVTNINFSIVDKKAYVEVLIKGKSRRSKTIDLTDKLAEVPVASKTIVMNLFKWVVAQALEVTEASLPDTIFEADESAEPSSSGS